MERTIMLELTRHQRLILMVACSDARIRLERIAKEQEKDPRIIESCMKMADEFRDIASKLEPL